MILIYKMAEIVTGGAHYQALKHIYEKGGDILETKLLDFKEENNLDFGISTLEQIGCVKKDKGRVYLTEKGFKRLERKN